MHSTLPPSLPPCLPASLPRGLPQSYVRGSAQHLAVEAASGEISTRIHSSLQPHPPPCHPTLLLHLPELAPREAGPRAASNGGPGGRESGPRAACMGVLEAGRQGPGLPVWGSWRQGGRAHGCLYGGPGGREAVFVMAPLAMQDCVLCAAKH